jgi:hypothetical protein
VTQFIRLADMYRLAPNSAFKLTEKLPAATYSLKLDKEGYYLELIDNFELPAKLYGDCTNNADRMIQTFWDRPNSTGVFLEGEKGSGKTLLAKAISQKLLAAGIPTIVINEPHFGEGFNTFIQSIEQPAVVFFDEFEKIYSNNNEEITGVNAQERVLTLFDGVYPTKKLYIVTCNDSWRIDKNMKNRPGRMYYMLSFSGLDEAFVREYAEENLKDKSQVDSVVSISFLFGSFNFDMLKAIVEEMNRYGESAKEAIKLLNAKPVSDKAEFIVKLIVGGTEITPTNKTWQGNPLTDVVNLPVMSDDQRRYTYYNFESTDIANVDAGGGTFSYANKEGQLLTLTRKTYEVYDYTKLF